MAPAWPLARALARGRPPTRRLRIISPSPVRSRPTLVAACGRPPARLLLHASPRRLAVSLWSRSAAVRSGRPRLPCSTFPSPRPSPPHPRASRQSPMSPYTSSSAVAPSARWRRPNCRPSRPGTSRPHAPPQDQLATRSWEHQRRRSARCSINVGVLPRPVSSTRWNQPANGRCVPRPSSRACFRWLPSAQLTGLSSLLLLQLRGCRGRGRSPGAAADARAGGTHGRGWPRTGAIAGVGLLPVLKALLAHVLPRCHHPNQALQGTPPG